MDVVETDVEQTGKIYIIFVRVELINEWNFSLTSAINLMFILCQ